MLDVRTEVGWGEDAEAACSILEGFHVVERQRVVWYGGLCVGKGKERVGCGIEAMPIARSQVRDGCATFAA